MTRNFGLAATAAILAATTGLAGCASGVGANQYGREQVGTINRVEEGVIVAARAVQIEGRQNAAVGTAAGAAIGGIAGSTVGGGDAANAAGAIGGAVIGGILGNTIERGATGAKGISYTVRKANGELINITQGADIVLQVGQRVFIEYGARARIVPIG